MPPQVCHGQVVPSTGSHIPPGLWVGLELVSRKERVWLLQDRNTPMSVPWGDQGGQRAEAGVPIHRNSA